MLYMLTKVTQVLKTVATILMIAIILQAFGVVPKALAAAEEGFVDMDNSHWSYDTVLWAQFKGIATGYPDGTFKPNSHVTESEFLAMLLRSMAGPEGVEAMVDPRMVAVDKHWAANYYKLAAQMNYPLSHKRDAIITRSQVAELIVGTQGKNYSGPNAIQYMLGNGLAKGRTAPTVEGYEGEGKLTRAEAAQFIRNVLEKLEEPQLLERPLTPSNPKDLPKLPEPAEKPAATAKEKMRDTVKAAFKGEPYEIRAARNEISNSILIDDAEGNTILTFSDNRATAGTRVTTFYGKSVENVEIVKRVWEALGIKVDDRLYDELIRVIKEQSSERVSIAYPEFEAVILLGGMIIQFTEVK